MTSANDSSLSLVIAHDYLTQKGGAERVVLELVQRLRPQKIVTAVYSSEGTFREFAACRICTTFLSKVRLFRRDPRAALPFLAQAWLSLKPVEADVVICSSSGWSHMLRTSKSTRKIVYCHNPARWLYQSEEYLLDRSLLARFGLALLRPYLRRIDKRAAKSADLYIANSTSVASRIRERYGIEPLVLFPPVSIDPQGDIEPIKGLNQPFFLTVGRPRGYKGLQPLIDAFEQTPHLNLVVAGGGKPTRQVRNVQSVGFVTDSQLRWLYLNATALISVSKEDFGLTPLEANAFGTPALLLRAGGFLDSTVEGVNGLFIENDSAEAIAQGIQHFPVTWDKSKILHHAAKFKPEEFARRMLDLAEDVVAGARV